MFDNASDKLGTTALALAVLAAVLSILALRRAGPAPTAVSSAPACSCDTAKLEREIGELRAALARPAAAAPAPGTPLQPGAPAQWEQKWSVPLPDGVSSVSVAQAGIRSKVVGKRLELENGDPTLAGKKIQVVLVLETGQVKNLPVRVPND